MNDKDIQSYQKLRANNGLPAISDKDALVEAQSLIHLMTIGINQTEQ